MNTTAVRTTIVTLPDGTVAPNDLWVETVDGELVGFVSCIWKHRHGSRWSAHSVNGDRVGGVSRFFGSKDAAVKALLVTVAS